MGEEKRNQLPEKKIEIPPRGLDGSVGFWNLGSWVDSNCFGYRKLAKCNVLEFQLFSAFEMLNSLHLSRYSTFGKADFHPTGFYGFQYTQTILVLRFCIYHRK